MQLYQKIPNFMRLKVGDNMLLTDYGKIGINIDLPSCKLDHIKPSIFRLKLEAMNDAVVPLHNAEMIQGMIYDAICDIDPKIAYAIHSNKTEKPWSFGDIFWKKYVTKEKGIYEIKKGSIGQWTFNTIDPIFSDIFKKINGKSLHYGSLIILVKSIKFEDHTYYKMPEEWSNITLHFCTPFFQRNLPNEFKLEKFMEMQIHKFLHFGIIDKAEYSGLLQYIRLLRDDTKAGIRNLNKDNFISGRIGYVTLKVSGDDDIKEFIFTILYLSQFIGCGSRTSLGYGHMEISKIT